MITEDYVSFETAKLMHDKGFNLAKFYGQWAIDYDNVPFDEEEDPDGKIIVAEWQYPLITLQMALKWLREEKDLYVMPQILSDGTYIGYIYRTDGFGLIGHDKRRVRNNPEEACESAIRYCLEELI